MLSAALSLTATLPSLEASTSWTGNVDPDDPSAWDRSSFVSSYVGKTSDGTLTINSGSSVDSLDGYVGYSSGVAGLVTVDGIGSAWTNEHDLSVGYSGTGTLNITNGGTVNNYNSSLGSNFGSAATATVDGAGSKWSSRSLYVGGEGNGALNVINGGEIITNGGGVIAYGHGATGVATVSGTGSAWTSYEWQLCVGCYGNGTLNITSGGAVRSYDGHIASQPASTGVVTVDGAGSTWLNSGNLHVGTFGDGTLNIDHGGAITVIGSTSVGGNTGSAGVIRFGSGGTLTTGSLWASPSQLIGTTIINTHGLVSDVDLIFDSKHGSSQTLTFKDQPNQNITIKLDMGDSTNYSDLGVGWLGNGSLTVRDGVAVRSASGSVGRNAGSAGTATVVGNGSIWHCSFLEVGGAGQGTLNIGDGGVVAGSDARIGIDSGSRGTVTIDGAGSAWNATGPVFVGDYGNGALRITRSGNVSSYRGYVGTQFGALGAVTVSGPSSVWTISNELYIGYRGNGTLSITNGGAISNGGPFSAVSVIGSDRGATGVVTVDGAGSLWTTGSLSVGFMASGTLNITGGGAVTATNIRVGGYCPTSRLTIDVGRGSSLILDGTIGPNDGPVMNNVGVVRIVAGAAVATGGSYMPISAASWSNSGTYQAVGGTWNVTDHTFTVSSFMTGTSGQQLHLDLANTQRVLFGLPASTRSVGVSFLAKSGSSSISLVDFAATAISGEPLADLELLAGGQTVLGAWQFAANGGYASDEPAYLSFSVGPKYARDDLQVWHYSGTDWMKYDAPDLTCNGGYASFTVTGFSGYAVTAVPEPDTWVLLLSAATGLLAFARRK